MRPLVAHCHLGLGTTCRQSGNREKAVEHLTAARTLYRGMGMCFWLSQVEAVLIEMGGADQNAGAVGRLPPRGGHSYRQAPLPRDEA
jgi:hypothetical protein